MIYKPLNNSTYLSHGNLTLFSTPSYIFLPVAPTVSFLYCEVHRGFQSRVRPTDAHDPPFHVTSILYLTIVGKDIRSISLAILFRSSVNFSAGYTSALGLAVDFPVWGENWSFPVMSSLPPWSFQHSNWNKFEHPLYHDILTSVQSFSFITTFYWICRISCRFLRIFTSDDIVYVYASLLCPYFWTVASRLALFFVRNVSDSDCLRRALKLSLFEQCSDRSAHRWP